MGKMQAARSAGEMVLQAGREASAAEVARAEELLAKARALCERISRDFWDLGRVLGAMREQRSHLALGFERFDAMVEELMGVPRTLAWKLIAVAEGLPRQDAARLGQERAYAVVALARAIPEVESAAALLDRADVVGGKSVTDATLRDLQTAVRDARPRRAATLAKRKAARELKALLKTMQERLAPLGIPRARAEVVGEELVVRVPLDLAKRIFGD